MHMLERAGVRPVSDFEALGAIAEIEAELFRDSPQESAPEHGDAEGQIPDDALEAALEAWVNAAGTNFVAEDDLDDAVFQLASAWKLLLASGRLSGRVEPQDDGSLRQQYRLNYPDRAGGSNDPVFRGWLAGIKEIERQLFRTAATETSDGAICTKFSIMRRFSLSEEEFAGKYNAWNASLRKNGLRKDWNQEIDAFAIANGFLTPEEVRAGKTDFEQAVLNRVKYASILNL